MKKKDSIETAILRMKQQRKNENPLCLHWCCVDFLHHEDSFTKVVNIFKRSSGNHTVHQQEGTTFSYPLICGIDRHKGEKKISEFGRSKRKPQVEIEVEDEEQKGEIWNVPDHVKHCIPPDQQCPEPPEKQWHRQLGWTCGSSPRSKHESKGRERGGERRGSTSSVRIEKM